MRIKSIYVAAVVAIATLVTVSCTQEVNPDPKKVTVSEAVANPNGYEYVDLGLPSGLKWATCNLGANSPEEYGDYFAWGETEPKSTYSESTYKWCNGSISSLTKYCPSETSEYWGGSYWGGFGSPDNKTVLDFEDDAALASWGGSWRMPTDNEWSELLKNSTRTWTSNYNGTGIAGLIVTASNGNRIFLPAVGIRIDTHTDQVGSRGFYWCSDVDYIYPCGARCIDFYPDSDMSVFLCGGIEGREYGLAIRPVLDFSFAERPVTSVSLFLSELTLIEGRSTTLTATVRPAIASDRSVKWSSSNPSVATVDSNGKVTGVKAGTATITVTTNDGGLTANCSVTVVEMTEPEAVDMGLSVKWASFNVGASKPEEYGEYFAWGEIEPKRDYSMSTYKFILSGDSPYDAKYNKYCPSNKAFFWGGSDSPDNKTILDPEDDAASANLVDGHRSWRMPTDEEWNELMTNCTWTWTGNYNGTGISGRVVTATNGNIIFIPAAGFRLSIGRGNSGSDGFYWSSSLYTDDPYFAWHFQFDSDVVRRYGCQRCDGLSVRPVSDYTSYERLVTGITLDKTELTLYKARCNKLTANVSPSHAAEKSVIWSSSMPSVATVNPNGMVTGGDMTGTATITATTVDGGYTASCSVKVVEMPKPEAIDMGLSVKWASFNVGASKPEEYGEYFAWGETKPKEDYSWFTCEYRVSGYDYFDIITFNKYCPKDKPENWSGDGEPDGLTVLEPEDDAASVMLGDGWRIPTQAEWEELKANCSKRFVYGYNGTVIRGLLITASNGNSIFLPAAGFCGGYVGLNTIPSNAGLWGNYWSSSLCTDCPPSEVIGYSFDMSDDLYGGHRYRYWGNPVRPVCDN